MAIDYCESLLRGNIQPVGVAPQQQRQIQAQYNISGLAQLMQERLRFNISLGGFDAEPYEATPLNLSPQLRRIAPGVTVSIPVMVVERQHVTRIASFNITHYSAQGKQDLQIRLSVGQTKSFFVSGLVAPLSLGSSSPVAITRETRVASPVGAPYSGLAKVGGYGFPDNFGRSSDRSFAIAYENESISWQIINQSDLYTHAVMLDIYGWTFPNQGRTKEENLKDALK